MKILIVSNGFPPTAYGGVEVYTYDLARELNRRGNTVWIFCRELARNRDDYTTWQEDVEGLPVIRIANDFKQVETFSRLYTDPKIDYIFGSLLDEFQPDLVHFNHFLALSASLPFEASRRKIPAIAMLHDYWTICQRINLINGDGAICTGPGQGADCYSCLFVNAGKTGGFIRLTKKILPYNSRVWIRRMLNRPGDARILFPASPADFIRRQEVFHQALSQVSKVIVPSGFMQKTLAENGFSAASLQVIPLGIGLEPQSRREIHTGEIHIGFVGSLTVIKGVEHLVRAFSKAPQANLRLDFFGRLDVHERFGKHVRDLAHDDTRITFRGGFAPEQRGEVFSRMDVLVIPSIWHETFSLVAREALRAGVPVIAGRVGALPEVVHDGVNGFLYPPGDEQALSAIFNHIAADPGCLANLQTPGPVDLIGVDEHVNRMERIYAQVTGSAESHPRLVR